MKNVIPEVADRCNIATSYAGSNAIAVGIQVCFIEAKGGNPVTLIMSTKCECVM